MARRSPFRFAHKPVDPRSRAVVMYAPSGDGTLELSLECGHIARRKRGLCIPGRVICADCPPAGGMGDSALFRPTVGRKVPHG